MKQLFHHINYLTSRVRCASIITSQQGLAFHLPLVTLRAMRGKGEILTVIATLN